MEYDNGHKLVSQNAAALDAVSEIHHLGPDFEMWFQSIIEEIKSRFWKMDKNCLLDKIYVCDEIW